MNKVISLIGCSFIAIFAQNEQYQQYPQQQPPQEQYQQYPQQQQYQQYPPQQQQYGVNTEQQREKVQKLIKADVEGNKAEIQRESFYLSPADKESLYERNRKKAAAGWAALDFGVGFGVGSYIQGDIAFGITQSIMDGLGYSLMIGGLYSYDCLIFGPCDSDNDARAMFTSGYLIFISSRISSWIFPFIHQSRYNKALKSALNNNNVSYSIDPLIVPKNEGAPAVGLAFNLRY